MGLLAISRLCSTLWAASKLSLLYQGQTLPWLRCRLKDGVSARRLNHAESHHSCCFNQFGSAYAKALRRTVDRDFASAGQVSENELMLGFFYPHTTLDWVWQPTSREIQRYYLQQMEQNVNGSENYKTDRVRRAGS